jgi:hypothetical protein
VGANSYIGVGTLHGEERNPSFVGVQEPDDSESKYILVATDQIVSYQAGRVRVPTTHHGKFRIPTDRDAEVAKTDRGVLVTASNFEIMLSSIDKAGPEEPRVIGGHNLGPIVRHSRRHRGP